jgi:cell division septal protein FtsQ
VKEGTTKRRSIVWVVISGGVLIASAITALYTPWLGILDVRQIVISGNRYAKAADLATLSGIRRGQTLLSVSTRQVERRLMTHPWVKHATVHREGPHAIRLVVEERSVVAWSEHPEDGTAVFFGEGGVVVDVSERPLPQLKVIAPPVTGWRAGDTVTDPLLVDLIHAIQHSVCGQSARTLDATDSRSLVLTLENDAQIRLGAVSEARQCLRLLDLLCREIELDGYELIDMRLGGEATLVPRKAVRR